MNLQQLFKSDKNGERRKVYVIGSEGLCNEIESSGFEIISSAKEKSGMSAAEIADIQDANHDSVDAVIVGLDTDFNYRKLSLATYHLRRNPEVPLIVTNEDAFDVLADNRYQPGSPADT